MEEILTEPVPLDPAQIICQVTVRVGEAVGEVDLVMRLSKRVRECQRVVASAESIAFSFEAVLVVVDASAHTVPTELLGAITRVLGEAKDAHAVIVQ